MSDRMRKSKYLSINGSTKKLENQKSLINILHIFGNDMENTVWDIMYFIKRVEDWTSACKLRWSILQDILWIWNASLRQHHYSMKVKTLFSMSVMISTFFPDRNHCFVYIRYVSTPRCWHVDDCDVCIAKCLSFKQNSIGVSNK